MAGLRKIRDLVQQYEITTRTLRYYEEIGLLWSERQPDSAYRQYDAAAVRRLEQILLLRRMQLSVKEIQAIFASREMHVAVETFARKLASIEREMDALAELRETVEAFLELLREKGFDQAGGPRLLPDEELATLVATAPAHPPEPKSIREDFTMPNELTHVRIVELKPMKVAAYRAESASPEGDAWDVLCPWIEERGLQDLPTTRYFGFDNPGPSSSRPTYGYEVWVTVPEGTEPSGPVEIKSFSGGLYAGITSYIPEIPQRWQQLAAWLKESDQWAYGPHQCLEEMVTPYGMTDTQKQLDLLIPIIRK